MASQDWMSKDFYAVLGVGKDATPEAVKKAYRKLARTHHPDANAGNDSRFKEIGEAYAVLSDPEQRQQYDAIRAMSGGARFTSGGSGPGAASFEDLLGGLFGGGGAGTGPAGGRVRYSTSGGGADPRLEDLLGGMFGGGTPGYGGFGAPLGPRPGADLTATASVGFRDALDGVTVTFTLDDPASGRRSVTARLPAGVRDGQKVRLRGQGRPGQDGGPPGDLMVTVHVEPHPVFTRDGEDLRLALPVGFAEAALGSTVEVPTLDGTPVRVRIAPGTPSGRVLRVRGRGVPAHGSRPAGDLLATVEVTVPQRLDGAAREAVEAFRDATEGEDPRDGLAARAAV